MFAVWKGTVAPGEAAEGLPWNQCTSVLPQQPGPASSYTRTSTLSDILIPVSRYPSSRDDLPAASSLKVALSPLTKRPTPQIVHLLHLPWLFSHSFPASLLNRAAQCCTVPFINGIRFTLLLKKKSQRLPMKYRMKGMHARSFRPLLTLQTHFLQLPRTLLTFPARGGAATSFARIPLPPLWWQNPTHSSRLQHLQPQRNLVVH